MEEGEGEEVGGGGCGGDEKEEIHMDPEFIFKSAQARRSTCTP